MLCCRSSARDHRRDAAQLVNFQLDQLQAFGVAPYFTDTVGIWRASGPGPVFTIILVKRRPPPMPHDYSTLTYNFLCRILHNINNLQYVQEYCGYNKIRKEWAKGKNQKKKASDSEISLTRICHITWMLPQNRDRTAEIVLTHLLVAIIDAMDRALQPAAEINYKRCTICKKAMDNHFYYKTCVPCRAIRNAKRREKQSLKIKEMQHTIVLAQANLTRKYDATGSSTKERQENSAHREGSHKLSAGVKRKAQKPLHELEGEERKMALKKAKSSLIEIIQQQGKKPLPTTDVKSVSDPVFVLMKYP